MTSVGAKKLAVLRTGEPIQLEEVGKYHVCRRHGQGGLVGSWYSMSTTDDLKEAILLAEEYADRVEESDGWNANVAVLTRLGEDDIVHRVR